MHGDHAPDQHGLERRMPPPDHPAAARGRRRAHAGARRALGSSSSSKKDKVLGLLRAVRPSRMTARPRRERRSCAERAPDGDHGRAPAEVAAELVLGRYRLGPRLGAGGFGTVFAATDERLRRAVAVKVIPARGPRRPDAGAARGAGRGPPRPSRDRRHLRRRPGLAGALSGLRAGPRPHARRAERRGRALGSRRRCGSASRCAARSSTRTAAASCTATSSRRT